MLSGEFDVTFASGSPPRAWGQRRSRPYLLDPHRFTPTRVGTTPSSVLHVQARNGSPPRAWGQHTRRACPWRSAAVHPHARGDNCPRVLLVAPFVAVHPHARGDNLAAFIYPWRYRRFTPTRVGTTLPPLITHGLVPVHPHARGDNLLTASFKTFTAVHPHARGDNSASEQP